MKKLILYKYYDSNRIWGGHGWSIKEKNYYQCNSTPYYVEIPDDLKLIKTHSGGIFLKSDIGYELKANWRGDGEPYLIGFEGDEIKLKVLGIVTENKDLKYMWNK